MEKPAEAQFTTHDPDEQHSKTTQVEDAGIIQGVEASMHAPKSKVNLFVIYSILNYLITRRRSGQIHATISGKARQWLS